MFSAFFTNRGKGLFVNFGGFKKKQKQEKENQALIACANFGENCSILKSFCKREQLSTATAIYGKTNIK